MKGRQLAASLLLGAVVTLGLVGRAGAAVNPTPATTTPTTAGPALVPGGVGIQGGNGITLPGVPNPLSIPGDLANDAAGAPLRYFAKAMGGAEADMLKTLLAGWTAVPTPRLDSAGTAGFVQDSVEWLVIVVAIAGLLIAAGRLIWERKADPAKEMLAGLIRLILVGGAGLAVVNIALTAGDAFSTWILNAASPNGTGAAGLSTLAATSLATVTNPVLVIIFAAIALIGCLVQIVLLIVRTALLPIAAGLWPLSAATSLAGDPSWFRKNGKWLLALILYKPAASLVYAVAIRAFTAPKTELDAITGVVLLAMASLTLPALVKFVAPMTEKVGSVSVAGAVGTAAMVATGAVLTIGTAGAAAPAVGAAAALGSPAAGGHRSISQPALRGNPATVPAAQAGAGIFARMDSKADEVTNGPEAA